MVFGIPPVVEEPVGIAPLRHAMPKEVYQRVEFRRGDILILLLIPRGIEKGRDSAGKQSLASILGVVQEWQRVDRLIHCLASAKQAAEHAAMCFAWMRLDPHQVEPVGTFAHGTLRFRAELTQFSIRTPWCAVTLLSHNPPREIQVALFLFLVEETRAAGDGQVALDHEVSNSFLAI